MERCRRYKIYIDQGHNPSGYHNTGAEGFGLREQDITYMVGAYLQDILNADGRFETKRSRKYKNQVLGTSNATSLRARVDEANQWPADYFISIHTNANENPAINGSEVYIYRFGSQAEYLARDILNEIVRRIGTKNNLVRENPSLYVLRKTTMPAVLVELAYITNPKDNELLRTKQYQFAYGIYKGLLDYLGLSPVS